MLGKFCLIQLYVCSSCFLHIAHPPTIHGDDDDDDDGGCDDDGCDDDNGCGDGCDVGVADSYSYCFKGARTPPTQF